jgi:transposase-like protein
MQIVEHRIGLPIDQALRDMYLRDQMTLEEIAREFGITKGTVSRWLAHFNIPTRYLVSDRPVAA